MDIFNKYQCNKYQFNKYQCNKYQSNKYQFNKSQFNKYKLNNKVKKILFSFKFKRHNQLNIKFHKINNLTINNNIITKKIFKVHLDK